MGECPADTTRPEQKTSTKARPFWKSVNKTGHLQRSAMKPGGGRKGIQQQKICLQVGGRV